MCGNFFTYLGFLGEIYFNLGDAFYCPLFYSSLKKLSCFNLVKHMGEKPCQCDICLAGFKNSNALRQHKDQIHFKTKIICPICGGIFVSKRNLKRHIESVHRGKKRKY